MAEKNQKKVKSDTSSIKKKENVEKPILKTKVKKQKTRKQTKRQENKIKDPLKIILYPHLAEKSMNMVEMENKLVFIVERSARKKDIKRAVSEGFEVEVERVNVEITPKGKKKAYVKLKSKYSASDIASRLGMI